MSRYLGREHAHAHSAQADAWATLEILEAQLDLHEDLPRRPAALHAELFDVDLARRFRREASQVIFAFGKHSGRPLAQVAEDDPGYLRWMLEQGTFLEDARILIRRALAGQSLTDE